MKFKERVRDWWRGYSDEDVRRLAEKLNIEDNTPGHVVELSRREWLAMRSIKIEAKISGGASSFERFAPREKNEIPSRD